ncbi:MAG TPA: RNA-binding protein [Candidatus Saccharimonadales bacterium]|nr:RNA-binding protein [Candidatus Saccharimonadales bacterium]
MATKLFVGKLSYDTTNDSLQALFTQYGKVVSAQVIIDRGTSQSKGFAFVEMEDDAAAQAAIAALDGKEFEGRTIVVNVAKPREDRPQGGGGDNGYSFRGGFQRR